MQKYKLQTKLKSRGTAYLCWFLFGCHYLYLKKYLIQVIYWLTFGGFGIWALIDFFTISSKVKKHNAIIYSKIDEIDKKEFNKSLEILKASK